MDAVIAKKLLRYVGTDPFFEISKQRTPGHEAVHQNFRDAAVSTVSETIWPYGGNYIFRTSARVLTVSCDSSSDTSGGSGAGKVHVIGLDANYNQIEEFVALNGSAAVSTTQAYLRVNEIHTVSAATGWTFNASAIYIGASTVTNGRPAEIWNMIDAGRNKSESGFYTIPAKKYGFLLKTTIFNSSVKEGQVDLLVKYTDHPVHVEDTIRVFTGQADHNTDPPHRLPPKTDFMLKAFFTSGPVDTLSGDFVLILASAEYIGNIT